MQNVQLNLIVDKQWKNFSTLIHILYFYLLNLTIYIQGNAYSLATRNVRVKYQQNLTEEAWGLLRKKRKYAKEAAALAQCIGRNGRESWGAGSREAQ
jgi:hypothetical protein